MMKKNVNWLVVLAAVMSGCSSKDTTVDDTASDDTASEDTGSEDTSSEDTGSEDTSSEDTGSADGYSLEDRWVLPGLNTMYEFRDGLRKTYYCAEADGCDHDDWAALTSDDAIPGENPYTFDGETLIIDLHHGNYFEDKVVFDCEGGRITMASNAWEWHRLGANLEDCAD